jgi:hypothetical protein
MTSIGIRLSVLVGVLFLAACSRPDAPGGPAATGIVVSVAPATARVPPGGTASFAGSVTGTVDTLVDWSITEGPAGGTVSPTGVYTAPPVEGVFHVVATSHADPSCQQVASVTVNTSASAVPAPGADAGIRIDPTSATLDACKGQVFAATVGGLADGSVTWAVTEPGGGTVTNGVYVSPATPGTYHVVATSVAEPSRVAQATVTVGAEEVKAVAIAPGSGAVSPAGSLALAATVTTSCGTFSSAGP